MTKSKYFPRKIYIEKASLGFPMTKRILKNASHVPVEIVEDVENLIDNIKISRDFIGEGKKCLLITQNRGKFVKPCPCTPHYIGCNYFIINLELQCPIDCTYCILQHYLENPMITVYVNTEDLWKQLDDFLYKNKNRTLRIGTGELGDSMALDHITKHSKDLISFFRKRKNAIFELKTKTVNIENILEIEPAKNIVVAWSLNSYKVAQNEEKGAPPVRERIEAARLLSNRGFRVGFHFDPIIRYQGWVDGYDEVVDELLEKVKPSAIAWISLGSLRFPPGLKTIIKKRFPNTKIIYEEFILGKDGKLRYFKPLRLQLYKEIIDAIRRKRGEKIPIYFCMESREIWRKTLRKTPRGKEEVEKYISLLRV